MTPTVFSDEMVCQVQDCDRPHSFFTEPGLYLCAPHSEAVLSGYGGAEAATGGLDVAQEIQAILDRIPTESNDLWWASSNGPRTRIRGMFGPLLARLSQPDPEPPEEKS